MTDREAIEIFEGMSKQTILSEKIREASRFAADVIRTGGPRAIAKWQLGNKVYTLSRPTYTKNGEDEYEQDHQYWLPFVCTNCKCEFEDIEFNEPGEEWRVVYWHFCPNCGAKMEEEE